MTRKHQQTIGPFLIIVGLALPSAFGLPFIEWLQSPISKDGGETTALVVYLMTTFIGYVMAVVGIVFTALSFQK